MTPKAIFCWSGGKDATYALHLTLLEQKFEVSYLLTTLNEEYKRVSMHGVREELLDLQAQSIGLPLLKVFVNEGTNLEYENKMKETLLLKKKEGITYIIFGDIFLEELREYREKSMSAIGITCIFPLWKRNTNVILNKFIKAGFRSLLCCVNDGYLNETWLGRELDSKFSVQLPGEVDPCGENGEYHTFCYDGPLFKNKINFNLGEHIYKELYVNTSENLGNMRGFWFIDLIPKNQTI